MGKICIIVLNWNRPDDTIRCLESLFLLISRDEASLILCDNASTDDSERRVCAWAQQHFQDVSHGTAIPLSEWSHNPGRAWNMLVCRTGANRGYAGGNNVGMRCALSHNRFEYIWLLNNDTMVEPDALRELHEQADALPDVAVFGSTIVDAGHRKRVQCAGGCRYNPVSTIMRPVAGGASLSEVMERNQDAWLDYVSGSAMFIRASALREIGLLNERYFLYYEEADFARRVKQTGYRLAWCPKSIVYHTGGATTGGRSSRNQKESWQANYYENLSTLQYTADHHPWLLPVASALRFIGKSGVYALYRRGYLFSALIRAYRNFWFGDDARDADQVAAEPRIVGVYRNM